MRNVDGFYKERSSSRKRLAVRFVILALIMVIPGLGTAVAAYGQARESATAGGAYVWVGGAVSSYYLQYGGNKNLGFTGFVDADSVRRFGVETEGRWLDYRQTNNVHAETYLAGPRYHFNEGRFQPYLKGLAGIGSFNFPYNYAHGRYFVIAPGGGLDYRLSPRWAVRVDGEYQYWPQFTFGAMTSEGISVGVRYLILR